MTAGGPRIGPRTVAAVLVFVLACAVVVAMLAARDSPPSHASRPTSAARPAVFLDTDGPAFSNLAALQSGAELIVKGTVLSEQASELNPASGAGVPQTLYKIRIDDVVQGDVSLIGRTISVATLGGPSGGDVYELPGLPALTSGSRAVLFLRRSTPTATRYFPLGGAAIATVDAKGNFTLPEAVTGGGTIKASVADMVCKAPRSHVRVTITLRGRGRTARVAGSAARQVGKSRKAGYKVKLVRGCRVVATGSVRGKSVSLRVRPASPAAKRRTYPRLRGAYVLRPNGGASIKAVDALVK